MCKLSVDGKQLELSKDTGSVKDQGTVSLNFLSLRKFLSPNLKLTKILNLRSLVKRGPGPDHSKSRKLLTQ